MGGVGKTRLAIQVAFDVADQFADGVWMVELGSISSPAAVPRAIARSVLTDEKPRDEVIETLVEALAEQTAMLVLDNCEHVLDEVARISTRLSRQCRRLTILHTSREPLDIDGEIVWRVNPMPVVNPRVGTEESNASDAVCLFAARARTVLPRFRLSAENIGDVTAIVTQLNGIPLAIELAAAALSDRPLEAIRSALADRFSLVTYGRRTGPKRHQTLRAALEWSLELLPVEERRLFAALAAFDNRMSSDAVATVCSGLVAPADAIPRILRHLARASLIVPGEHADRWSMLESVRQLAEIELDALHARPQLIARHQEWFARRAADLAPHIGRAEAATARRELTADEANFRRAIHTAIEAQNTNVALRLCNELAPFWTSHGDWSEGCELLEAVIALPDFESGLRASALVALGHLLLLRGDLASAEARFVEARRLAPRPGDTPIYARAVAGEGHIAFRRSQLTKAQSLWEEALGIAERSGDGRTVASTLRSLAICSASSGRQDVAGQLLDRALQLARALGDDQQVRLLLGSIAELRLWLGDYQSSEQAYGEALALASSIGDLSARPLILAELGWVALLQGDIPTAQRLAVQSVELGDELGSLRVKSHALRLEGEALIRRADYGPATTALAAALDAAQRLAAPAEIAGVCCSQAYLALAQGDNVSACRLAEQAGAPSSLEHTMRLVSWRWILGVVALIRGDLPAAEQVFRDELAQAERAQLVRHQANDLWGLARVAASSADTGKAARLHHRALMIRYRIGDNIGMSDSLVGLATVLAPSAAHDAARLLQAALAMRARVGAKPTRREAVEITTAVAAIRQSAEHVRLTGVGSDSALDERSAVELANRLVEVTVMGVR
ncbi:hypothetical protein GCM10022236_27390 [Microlunatus ginsengisoli]|uniref:Tetratricopeptide repeat protein n=2 Tax=Microlunatus ginsengisoli TaxID=363863 RepID=A0ABP7A289_9ACTN